jgi:hypothetical protein
VRSRHGVVGEGGGIGVPGYGDGEGDGMGVLGAGIGWIPASMTGEMGDPGIGFGIPYPASPPY